jgi:tetratricopeptide (TPR) repeat protein
VAIDREDTLNRAEKLLRQGRLDAAIVEYQRVAEAYPTDWNTANALGDLFQRAHQSEKAIAQYLRIAEHFASEGFLPRASAVYRKVLRLDPRHEHALLQLADVAIRQGILVEARQCLSTVADVRTARGDANGAAEVALRLGALDGDDLAARFRAACEALATGVGEAAHAELRSVAAVYDERGEHDRAAEVLAALFDHAPGDREVASRLVHAHLAAGRRDQALACLDAMGEIDDLDLLLVAGTLRAEAGRLDGARAAFARLLAREPHRCEAMVRRGAELAADNPEAALAHLEPAADVLILRSEYEAAADAFEQFVSSQPQHVPALQRLAEICLDGDLEERLAHAQVGLVDAFLATGRGAEARVVAEDLVSRHPEVSQHLDRLREALRQAGEPDIEAVIADRLSARGLAGDDTLAEPSEMWDGAALEGSAEPTSDLGDPVAPLDGDAALPASRTTPPRGPDDVTDPFRLGPVAIDLGDILGDALGPGGAEGSASDEVDLSAALDGLAPAPGARGSLPAAQEPDLEEVFGEFREEVSRDSRDDEAAQQFKLGLAFRDMGMPAEAMKALEVAARSPRLRFEAASLLGRLCNERGERRQAVEWLERAAEAPAPSVEEARTLLYDLADTLEASGEAARALAVFLELQADAGEYRDVRRRIARLSPQAGGG